MSNGFYRNPDELSDEELLDPPIGRFVGEPTIGGIPNKDFYRPPVPDPPPQNQDSNAFVRSTHHTAYMNNQGKRILDGFVIDEPVDFNTERQLTILFGGVRRAREIFDQIYNAPQNPETGERDIPSEVDVQPTGLPDDGDQSGLKAGASESEAKAAFDKQAENKRSDARLAAIRSGSKAATRITPNRSGFRETPDEGVVAAANLAIREQFSSSIAMDYGEPPTVEPPSPASRFLNDPIYGSIVGGWNEKLAANNVKLSSLVPFAELYVVFPEDDFALSQGTNQFTGIKNRVSRVNFIGGKTNDTYGRTINIPPPVGIPDTAWVAKIGSTASQTQPDYFDYTSDTSADAVRSYKGQPGISDVAVSRASSGSFNIKYDLSLTLPNPEIINEQYEYSKLLLLNSTFLLFHGWNVKDSSFSADSYPPKIEPSDTGIEVTLNGGNNGFWSASLMNLFNFTFEFDNVGHLVGKMRFLTSQGAFMSSVSTDMVSSPMLKALKKVPPSLLNRARGRKQEDKQNFIFANGVPWSKADISDDLEAISNSTTELALREAYRQLNDNKIYSGGNLSLDYFSGNTDEYSFDRYQKIKGKIENSVQRAANAVRDIFMNWGKQKNNIFSDDKFGARSAIPRGASLSDYDIPELDSRFMTIGNISDYDVEVNRWKISMDQRNQVKSGPYPRSTIIEGNPQEGIPLVTRFHGERKQGQDLFGTEDMRKASRADFLDDFDSFLYEKGSDLRNYYYNCILLNEVARDEEGELAFIPPEGFGLMEKNGVVIITDEAEASGDAEPSAENLLQFFKTMGKGQLIDSALREAVPSFEGPPTPQGMPDFGQDLQRRIRDRFNDTDNLNNPNLSDGADVLDTSVKETMRQSSILSVPSLVTSAERPAPPAIPLSTTSQETIDDTLLIVNLAARLGSEDEPLIITDIEIPNGYSIIGDNIYSFSQPTDSEATEDGTELTLNQRIVINNQRVVAPGERPAEGDFYVQRRVFVLNSGYSIVADRTAPSQDFVDSSPQPILINNDGDVQTRIPEIGQMLNSTETPDGVKTTIQSLIDAVGEHVGSSQILTQRELGNTANIDVEINDIKYDVVMRPTYFWLGSVLESLSETLNHRVKFYYKPLPSTTGKLTIPMPASAKSGELAEIDAQIFDINKQITLLGGDPAPYGKREDHAEGQTPEQEAAAIDRFLIEAVSWSNDFSNYMNDVIENKVAVGAYDNQELFTPSVGNGFSPLFKFEITGGKTFDNFIKDIYSIPENREQVALEAGNQRTSARYYFQIVSPIYAPVGTATDDVLVMPPGIYSINGAVDSLNDAFVLAFINRNGVAARENNGGRFPTTNEQLRIPNTVNEDQRDRVDRLKETARNLSNQKAALGFDQVFNNLEIKTTYEIPVDIGAIDQILTAEGGAPTHSMLKKILSAASQTMPQLQLSMRPLSEDPSYIEVFVNAINVDGLVQEVFSEITIGDLTSGEQTVDQFRSSVERLGGGDYLKSGLVMVCNFGTIDSLVENFQMSSKVDANAFATFRLPSVMGGVSMDIGKILSGKLISSGVLADVISIIEKGPVGGKETLKELQIVNEDGDVTEEGINNLASLLTNAGEAPEDIIIRKASQGFIEDLMSQDVKFYSKIMALQNQYFNGLTEATTNTTNVQDGQRFAGSRFYGNILNTYLRTVTLTIHGTTNLNIFNYVYLKGLLTGVEGLYVINSVSESVTPTSFTTTIECKLVEYVENRPEKNPLAYRGESSFRRFAEINRSLRLPVTGNSSDATISAIDFQDIAARIKVKTEQD